MHQSTQIYSEINFNTNKLEDIFELIKNTFEDLVYNNNELDISEYRSIINDILSEIYMNLKQFKRKL